MELNKNELFHQLHNGNPTIIINFSMGYWICKREEVRKMIDKNYYVNVKDLMVQLLPRPRPKKNITVFVTGWNEWLRLIVW